MIKIEKKLNIDEKGKKRIIIAIIISILIEVFICNYPAFRSLLIGKSKEINNYKVDDSSIIISNINERVTSINIEYKEKLTDKVTYELKYTAEENSDLFSLKPKVVLENQKQYINLDTHSSCKTIQLDLLTESDFSVENIFINKPNFNINVYRIIIFFVIAIFIIKVKDESIYKEYDKNSKSQNHLFMLNLMFFCGFVAIYLIYQFNPETLLIKKENISNEDALLMQTEAFINGQVKLLPEASEELKEMENPYDNIERDQKRVPYLYDVAYYNGNYYNYFGVAPIITTIMPFRLITGMYTHTYIFNLVYMLGIAISLYFLYKKLVDRYIKKLSLCNFYLGYYAILFGANILTLLRGAKYDIVVTSGIMFMLISINLAISIYENKKYKYIKLILLGITTALIVLSKPNLIVYYSIIVLFLLLDTKEISLREKIKDSIFIAVPLGILAIFQMILNYLRFDSILEFGAKYQLTGFNMNYCMSFTFGKIYLGILEYIFRIPVINVSNFPFIFINTETSLNSVNEVCYENRLIGLIAIPILWIYLFKKNILDKSENKELKIFTRVCLCTCIIAIILNTCLGGICEAYAIDFKLILCINAVILLLKLVEQSKDKKEVNKLFIFICLATIITMLPISLTTEVNLLTNLRNPLTVYLKNMFEFWC